MILWMIEYIFCFFILVVFMVISFVWFGGKSFVFLFFVLFGFVLDCWKNFLFLVSLRVFFVILNLFLLGFLMIRVKNIVKLRI